MLCKAKTWISIPALTASIILAGCSSTRIYHSSMGEPPSVPADWSTVTFDREYKATGAGQRIAVFHVYPDDSSEPHGIWLIADKAGLVPRVQLIDSRELEKNMMSSCAMPAAVYEELGGKRNTIGIVKHESNIESGTFRHFGSGGVTTMTFKNGEMLLDGIPYFNVTIPCQTLVHRLADRTHRGRTIGELGTSGQLDYAIPPGNHTFIAWQIAGNHGSPFAIHRSLEFQLTVKPRSAYHVAVQMLYWSDNRAQWFSQDPVNDAHAK